MATKIGVGESKNINSFEAGKEAAKTAIEKAQISKCDFVITFATVGYDQKELINGIRLVTGNAPLAGSSGDGLITQSGPNEEIYGVTVMAISSDEIKFQNAVVSGLKENSKKAGIEIAKQLNVSFPKNPITLMLFPDCLTVNTSELFEGIEKNIKKPLPFIGGTSFDNWQFKKTYQYFNGEVLSNSVVAVLVSGEAKYLIKVNHGCEPLGIERIVTKAKKNVIYEIDNKSAWEVFQEYIGPAEKETPFGKLIAHLSFGIKLPKKFAQTYDEYVIRTPMGLDEKTGAITVSAEIPKGTVIQLVRRDNEKIFRGVKQIAAEVKKELEGKKIIAAFQFDCAGRGGAVLGPQVKEIGIDPLQNTLGKDIPWIGFYTGGEIAPIKGKNFFHNYTVILVVLYK